MIVKRYILKTLGSLDSRYNQALRTPTPEDSVYFSKLAILEYCGWIEETFDQIVRRSVKDKLKTIVFQQILETNIIGNTHGFQYKAHFRPMLMRAIGLKDMETIETHLKNTGQFEILISELDSVKEYRNRAAHTWIDGTTRTYPAPSLTKSKFEKVYPIMKNIYSQVIRSASSS
jgi:hypothetical protein